MEVMSATLLAAYHINLVIANSTILTINHTIRNLNKIMRFTKTDNETLIKGV